MHRFSIIVPMLGDRRSFDDTLASVLRYRPNGSQIILVHDGTYDDPYRLRSEVDFVTTSGHANLIRFFHYAMLEATGDLIALVRPGAQLTEGWNEPVESAFEDPRIASVSPILATPGKPNYMVAAGVSYGSGFRRQIVGCRKKITPRRARRTKPLGPTSWAAFYRREPLQQIGICGERMDPHYLDLDIALSLKTIGYESAFCPECTVDVERATLITQESNLPHGTSAQRSFRRHAAHSSISLFRLISVFAGEIMTSSVRPWRLEHACQRIRASQFSVLDRHYAQGLSILQRQKRRDEGTSVPGDENVPENNRPKTGQDRRAA